MDLSNITIAIVGLGYVGLPLLTLFSRFYRCVGVDINPNRLAAINESRLAGTVNIGDSKLTSSFEEAAACDFYIICVPTPIHEDKTPDLTLLQEACKHVGAVLRSGDIVVFESTVYPGATDEVCIPLLEKFSSLVCNKNFAVVYSPERINIGDSEHSIQNTPKIISASNAEALETIKNVYGNVLSSNTVCASSIKVAEASKMYENVQRDVLIGLANEYADYCRSEGIDINEVTRCAATKWNFANVLPGLVGGHCIAVDPYYLIERAIHNNMSLAIVPSARKKNEEKSNDIALNIIRFVEGKGVTPSECSLLLLGFSYKPNTSDVRNTKVAQLLKLLKASFGKVECYDPLVDAAHVDAEYGIQLKDCMVRLSDYDFIFKVVAHKVFESLPEHEVIDIKVFL